MIRILDLWATHGSLDRMRHFHDGVEDDGLPPVFIALCRDGVYEIRDGHHRIAYYRLQGRQWLEDGEYYVIRVDGRMDRLGTIDDVLERCGLVQSV